MHTRIICCTWVLGILLFASCSKNNGTEEPTTPTENPSTGNPVETGSANANYKPAFAGQTRIGSVKTTTSIQATLLTSALVNPWGIAQLPDGRFLITEKSGTMRIVSNTGTVGATITGFPTVNSAGQGGLLDLCIDPNFTTNRMVYWTYVRSVTGGTVVTVAKGRLSTAENTIESPLVLYTSTTPGTATSNFGSRIMFDGTGNLLVSFGDRTANVIRQESQALNSSIGKIIRINTNGAAASGNPSFSGTGALPELYTIGHRNPQGMAVHPVTGEIWQTEHGPRGGDELNRLKPGANYGWPIISYGIEYSGEAVGSAIQQQNGMEQPFYYWDPVVSPSGITFYAGSRIAEWQNNLFLCSLTQTHIIRLVLNNDYRVIGEERLFANEQQRFRDIIQGQDNALYTITDSGRLYKIDRN
ncbi:PQQ-dependent sugar dehydrogenase [Pedobacter sp. MW01-1-1]|uniref:PQQ-dependent sugar dehydrogenase n=1 Tax=Pedobacter sp. MW01-1-1 TaxID=3383027 RepID=UPI003FEE87E0